MEDFLLFEQALQLKVTVIRKKVPFGIGNGNGK